MAGHKTCDPICFETFDTVYWCADAFYDNRRDCAYCGSVPNLIKTSMIALCGCTSSSFLWQGEMFALDPVRVAVSDLADLMCGWQKDACAGLGQQYKD